MSRMAISFFRMTISSTPAVSGLVAAIATFLVQYVPRATLNGDL